MSKKIKVEKSILSENDLLANKNRKMLDEFGVFSINIMASPGAGKTTLIDKTISALKSDYQIGVIDGDVVDVDLKKISHHKVQMSLANTGGSCHLDAVMMKNAMSNMDINKIDLLIVENVGNLICPSSFALGTHKNVVIASVPEGDDKPYKYPKMFYGADVVILNKIDYMEHEDFDLEYFSDGVEKLNEKVDIIPLSCKTDEGLENWVSWIRKLLV